MDPQFRDAAKADFALAGTSPVRAANTGVADPLAPSGEKWALLAEEKAMIPDGDTRDYNAWKKPGASAPTNRTVKAPPQSASGTPPPTAGADALKEKLQGVWVLAGTPEKMEEPPKTGGRLKFIGNGVWTLTQVDPQSGKEVYHHGGTYSLSDSEYAEKVEYANENTADLVGKTFKFSIKIDGDLLTQKGIDNSWNEVWKRLK